MEERTTLLKVVPGADPPPALVCVGCLECKESFFWVKDKVLPDYCPSCGARHVELLPRSLS